MFESFVYYNGNDRQAVEEAIPHLNNKVFDCWKSVPTFTLGENEDLGLGDEFSLTIHYESPYGHEKETQHGHEALDLAQAFISGFITAHKKVKKDD